MDSGWSNANSGILFSPLFSGEAKLTFNHTGKGAMQSMGLSCPTGIHLGERSFKNGDVISGSMEIKVGDFDIWNPDIFGDMKLGDGAPKPQKTYQEYIDLWLSFSHQNGLWIDLGENMGMFHRGWFNFLSEKKVSGVLSKGETWDAPLIELAWGGSANVVIMETLFRAKDPRAEKILNALLYFRDGGFMHENGSWINAYQAKEEKFSDRYGRAHSEVATGGVVNIMIWRCIKRGFVQEKEIKVFTERLKEFCDKFLDSLTSSETGGIAFSRFWNGAPGKTREGIEYPEDCYPVSDAFASFSYLAAYKLTEDKKYLDKFKKLLPHLLEHLRNNEWRFMEYDTLGADAVAPSWILLVIDEIIENADLLDSDILDELWKQYHRTYKTIHSFIREREDYPNPEWKAAETWGGHTITQGGIIHGSTAASTQGAHSVHLRFDFPLAMAAYAKRTQDNTAMTDLESYLNWTTWLQYTDPRWPDIIGASTEHVTFRQGYVQDTAQIKHGNPIAMFEWLEMPQ
jgi:hypothetical protein